MKALILGVNGMLGHQLYLKFKESGKFYSVKGAIREKKSSFKKYKIFTPNDIYGNIDFLTNGFEKIKNIIFKYEPDVVVNCVVVRPDNIPKENYFLINSFLPHYLAKVLNLTERKLIQISTDGVFTGERGNYSEKDIPDAKDIYGQSKFLGEIEDKNHLTIRTSIFGHELSEKKTGLLEWFLSDKKKITGYKNVYFSGVTTNFLAEIIIRALDKKIGGIINVGAERKISKYELLSLINRGYSLSKKIRPFKLNKKVDRSLNITKMLNLGIQSIDYPQMIRKMREEYIQRNSILWN